VLCEKFNPEKFSFLAFSINNNQIGHSFPIGLFDALPHDHLAAAYSSAILDRLLLNYRIYRR